MTASFPWYDLPSVQWANDRIWATMYPDGPPLERDVPYEEQWRSPDLVISQACGLDLHLNSAPLKPVFTPVFDLPDCREGEYFSYLIGRPGHGVAAVNSLTSRSGFSVLLGHSKPGSLLLTGSHLASIDAVRNGHADFASIDAVTWHLLKRDAPEQLGSVEVAERLDSAMAPPYVVRRGASNDAEKRLSAAMEDPSTAEARSALLLRGIKPVSRRDYQKVFDEYERIKDLVPNVRRYTLSNTKVMYNTYHASPCSSSSAD